MIDEKSRTQTRIGAFATLCAITACIIILMAGIPAAHAQEDQPTVYIQSYTVTPQVLAPGDSGTITVVIRNTAGTSTVRQSSGISAGGEFETVKNVDIPIQIDSVSLEGKGIKVLSESYHQFGSLGPGQSATVTFSIQAPNREGMFFPEVWVDINGGKNIRYPVPVNVNANNQVLRGPAFVVTKSLPESVNPGDSYTVGLTLKNAGTLRAHQIILTVNTSSSSIGIKGSNTLVIDDLDGGASKDVTIDFLTDKKAPTGLLKTNLLFTYQLPDGTTKSQVETIEVPIKGVADLGFVSVDTNPPRLSQNAPFDLTIRIENSGTGEAKQVSATVDLPSEGTKEAFIGKIKPGNDAPAIFLLEGAKAGTHPYTLTVTYTDDMGVHTLTRQMNLRVPAADTSGTIIFVIIILGVLGFVAYRYWYLPKINGAGKFPWVKKN